MDFLSRIHLPSIRFPSFPVSQYHVKQYTSGILIGILLSASSYSVVARLRYRERKRRQKRVEKEFESDARPIELRSDEVVRGITGLIGNTPLMRINSLSDALGVEILGKAEFLNPGGSVKDRVALRIIDDAERLGLLHPHTGSRIFEGTVGSTGISIATIAKARGYNTTIILPDDVAAEKIHALEALGAEVEKVRPASIVDKKQYVNLARQRALHFSSSHDNSDDASVADSGYASTSSLPTKSEEDHLIRTDSSSVVVTTMASVSGADESRKGNEELEKRPRGFFADQFENMSNYEAHLEGTGPEIWRQTNGRIDAFVCGAGTGGTIAGVGRFLKTMHDNVLVCLADPDGSGLYNKVKHNIMYDEKEREGTRRRHQVDTVVEGIGINRLTKNVEVALGAIGEAFRIPDPLAIALSRYLVEHDGLFLGSSSAVNLAACVKLIKSRGWDKRVEQEMTKWDETHENGKKVVVTVLCDSGTRHYSKFWNDVYLENVGIKWDVGMVEELLKDG